MGNIRRLYSGFKQIRWARNRARKEAEKLVAGIELPVVTRDQKNEIRSVWGDIHVDTKWFAYFNLFREPEEQWSPRFVPANLHYGVIDLFFSSNTMCSVIEDKNLNNLLYSEVIQPKTVLRCVKNATSGQTLLLDANYNNVDKKKAFELLSTSESLICKPAIASGGGETYCFLIKICQ